MIFIFLFFFFTFSVAVGRCLYHVCRATPCPLPTRRGSFSNTRPRQSRHGPRICSLERDNAIHTQYAHRKLNTPTHTHSGPAWVCHVLCDTSGCRRVRGKRAHSKKDPFCLLFWLNFKISLVLFRCLFFFYQPFCHCWIRRLYPSFSLPEFYTANFSHCLSLWVRQVL